MKHIRLSGLVAMAGLAALLSGCVVAPIGPRPVAVYPAQPVCVDAAPVVVVPAPRYYGYRGHGYWR